MKPIAIQVGGLFLDMGSSLRFKLLNPMFETDSIPGINVFPFDLPGTPGNKRLLGFFNLAEDNQYINKLDAVIYLYGNAWIRGALKYRWTKDHFEAQFSQVMKLYDNKDKKLTSITIEPFDFVDEAGYGDMYDHILTTLDTVPSNTHVVFFPQFNPSVFNNKEVLRGTPTPYVTPFDVQLPGTYAQYINYYDYHEEIFNGQTNHFWFFSIGTPPRIMDMVMSPSFYIKDFIKLLFAQNDFPTVESPDFLDISDIGKLVMTTSKFFRMRITETSGGGNVRNFAPSFPDFTDFLFKYNEFLPDLTIIQFLNGIKNTFNLSYFFGLIDGKVEIVNNKNILADESYVEWTHKCYLLHEKDVTIVNGVTLNYTPSDDNLIQFIRPVRNRSLLDPVATYASLPAVSLKGLICLVLDEHIYYEQDYGLSGLEWFRYSTEVVHYAEGGDVELLSGSDTWHVERQVDQIEGILTDNINPGGGYPGKKEWRVPAGEVTGSRDQFGLKPKDSEFLRLLFFRGIQLYNEHYNYYTGGASDPYYPYATNDEYDPTCTTVLGGLSLLWNGELGLFEKWWSKWVEFLKIQVPIRRVVELTLDDLLSFDFKKKKMIDGQKYFVKEGDVVISNEKGIEPAVIDFLKASYVTIEWDADALIYIAACGFTNMKVKLAINKYFKDTKIAGVYALLDAVYLDIADDISSNAAALAQMKYNAVNPLNTDGAFRRTYVNSPTADYSGLKFNGTTQYLNTHFNISSLSPNDFSMAVYCTEDNLTGGNQADIGQWGNATVIGTWSGSLTFFPNGPQYSITGSIKNLIQINLISGVGYLDINDGGIAYSNTSGSSFRSLEIFEGCANDSTGSPDFFSDRKRVYSHIGTSFTSAQTIAYATIINQLQKDIEVALGLAAGTRSKF